MAIKHVKGFRWKFEIFKMGLYIYVPIFTWYIYNTNFVQVNFIYPRLKKHNYALYKKLLLDEDEYDKP